MKKKPKSHLIFDTKDFPISHVRATMIQGTGSDINELAQKPLIAVANSQTDLNPGNKHLKFLADKVKENEVIVIRYKGPKGGPGMPETLAVTLALNASGLKNIALVTDGRFSGASSCPCKGHVSPEAYAGGPIAVLRNGDLIEIDIPGRKINVTLSETEIKNRIKGFRPKKRDIPSGYMQRYVQHVSSAARSAILE